MPLFTEKERIAVIIISILILAGWIVRFYVYDNRSDQVTVIRNAVEIPEEMINAVQSAGNMLSPVLLDINTATQEEFEALPMIGPASAATIVEFRKKNGQFSSPEDITRVPGIGPGIYSRISDLITTSNGDSVLKK